MLRLRKRAEVLLHIALRAKQPLLFARPQRNPDRPLRLDVQRLQDAHRLHRHDRARAVVGRACAGDPAIQMAADHHDLVLQLRIGSGNLRDGIEAMLVVARELRLDVHLERHRHMVLQQPAQPVVVLDHHHRVRNRDRVLLHLRVRGRCSRRYRRR